VRSWTTKSGRKEDVCFYKFSPSTGLTGEEGKGRGAGAGERKGKVHKKEPRRHLKRGNSSRADTTPGGEEQKRVRARNPYSVGKTRGKTRERNWRGKKTTGITQLRGLRHLRQETGSWHRTQGWRRPRRQVRGLDENRKSAAGAEEGRQETATVEAGHRKV